MGKLRLDLESLDVQSFETVAAGEARGTVRAHGATQRTACAGKPTTTRCAP